MILLDSNVLMYAAGAPHEHKTPCERLLERIGRGEVEAAVDAEVLQEVLHRYRSIRRWKEGRVVYDLARRIVSEVLPIDADALDLAREILDRHAGVSARDALHAAAALLSEAEAICSYDRDFDRLPEIRRIEPSALQGPLRVQDPRRRYGRPRVAKSSAAGNPPPRT